MADVISELLVRINAEDNASAVLGKVSNSVESMSGAGAKGAKSVEQFTGAMKASKTSAEAYRKKMSEASDAVAAKKKALNSVKTAYDNTTKAAQANTAKLSIQKAKTETLIQSKKREIAALELGNSAINKGSQKYKDNQKAIQWTKTELEALETEHKSIVQSMGRQEESLVKSAAAYKAAKTEVKAAQETYSGYSAGLTKVEQAEKAAARAASIQKFESAGESIKSFGEGIDKVTKPLQIAAVGAVGAGVAVTKAAMEYETAFTGVKKTVEGTPEQLEKVNTEIQDMSKRIPVSAAELANLAATAGQLGVDANHISKFTEVTAAMGVATNLAGEEGAATLAQFINVSGDSLDNVDRVGSAIVALGNNTATTEADIAHMALRMGKFGNTVHMTSDEVLGYSAALASSGIEAQLGGSAIGRTWLDIQGAVSGNTETLQKYAKYAGTTAEDFKKQWSTDASGAFNGLIKGLSATDDLTAAMMDLGINNTQDQQAVMALANNYDLLEKCMNLSSGAYKENTALMKEANTAYGTTASQIQLAKNAVNGAARSWGNLLLPEVTKGAAAVGGFADKIANADEGTKKAVISGAKAVVITGAAVKGTTSLIKGIGGTVEGIANIKKGIDKVKTVAGTGGAFSAIAKGAAAAGSAILPVGAAIVGVTAAVGAGKLIYDSYYKSTYKFADGLKEQGEAAKKAYNEWKELNNLQWEYNDLSGKMERGELNGEDLEYAKQRIEEIKKTLSEKFKIDIDSGDIDDAIEKAKTLSEIDVLNSKRSLRNELDDKKGAYDEAAENLPKLTTQLKEAKAAQEKYNNTKLEIAKARDAFESGTMGEAEYMEKVKTSMKGVLGEGIAYKNWLTSVEQAQRLMNMTQADALDFEGKTKLNSLIDNLNIDEFTKKISDYRAAINSCTEAARSFADINLSQMEDAFKVGGDITPYMQEIGNLVKDGLINADEYAKKAAQIQTGQKDLNKLFSEGGQSLSNFVSTYISDMQKFGASTQDTVTGAALLKNGFTDVSQACAKGGDAVKNVLADIQSLGQQQGLFEGLNSGGIADKMTEIAHSMGLIPKEKKITINADGDISLIDNAEEKAKSLQNVGSVSFQVNADGNINVLDEAGNKVDELKQGSTIQITVDANANDEELEAVQNKAKALKEQGINVDIKYTNENEPPELEEKTTDVAINYTTGNIEEPPEIVAKGKVDYTTGNIEKPDNATADGKINYTAGETPKKVPDTNGKANYTIGNYPKKASAISGKANYTMGNHPTTAPTIHGTAIYTMKVQKAAKGTQNFGGGLAMVNDQTGISDPRELIVDRGRAFIPQGRNVILPLSRGAKVYTAAQTKQIMANMGIPRYADGKDNSDAFKTAKDDWTHYTRTHAVSVTEEMKKWVALSKEFTSNQKDVEDIQEGIYAATRKVRDEQNELSEEYLATRAVFNDWNDYGDSMIAGFKRVSDREKQYVKDSVITEKEATTYLKKLGKDMFDDRVENSKAWLERQVKYNNMAVESYVESVGRMKAAAYEAYNAGMITSSQLNVSLQEYDDMISDKIKESNTKEYETWRKDAEEYKTNSETFGWMNGDDEVQWNKRVIAGIQERFKQGKISWETYIYDVKAALRELHSAETDTYEEMLESQKAYIDKIDDSYNELINKKEEAFDMKVLTRNISEANEKAKIYAGAVTQRGKDIYKETVENLEDLRHQKTIKDLQAERTEIVEKMRSDLELAEKYKKPLLNSLSNAQIDIAGIARSIQGDTANMQGLFNDLLKGIENLRNDRAVTYGATYNVYGVGDGIMKFFMPKAKQALMGG